MNDRYPLSPSQLASEEVISRAASGLPCLPRAPLASLIAGVGTGTSLPLETSSPLFMNGVAIEGRTTHFQGWPAAQSKLPSTTGSVLRPLKPNRGLGCLWKPARSIWSLACMRWLPAETAAARNDIDRKVAGRHQPLLLASRRAGGQARTLSRFRSSSLASG